MWVLAEESLSVLFLLLLFDLLDTFTKLVQKLLAETLGTVFNTSVFELLQSFFACSQKIQ